eukprot:3359178-Pleurochrysis_carterae.AAC.1
MAASLASPAQSRKGEPMRISHTRLAKGNGAHAAAWPHISLTLNSGIALGGRAWQRRGEARSGTISGKDGEKPKERGNGEGRRTKEAGRRAGVLAGRAPPPQGKRRPVRSPGRISESSCDEAHKTLASRSGEAPRARAQGILHAWERARSRHSARDEGARASLAVCAHDLGRRARACPHAASERRCSTPLHSGDAALPFARPPLSVPEGVPAATLFKTRIEAQERLGALSTKRGPTSGRMRFRSEAFERARLARRAHARHARLSAGVALESAQDNLSLHSLGAAHRGKGRRQCARESKSEGEGESERESERVREREGRKKRAQHVARPTCLRHPAAHFDHACGQQHHSPPINQAQAQARAHAQGQAQGQRRPLGSPLRQMQ